MIVRVHQPECNVWCNERGHWLLPSGPLGEPFSHQEPPPSAESGESVWVGDHPDGGETACPLCGIATYGNPGRPKIATSGED